MTVVVRLFAKARDLVGCDCVEFRLSPTASVGQLRAALLERYPTLVPIGPRLLASVDAEYASDEESLRDQAEVAFFPPVSGG